MRGKNKMSYNQLNLFNESNFNTMLTQYIKDNKTYQQGNYTYTKYINMIDSFTYSGTINDWLKSFIKLYKLNAYSYVLTYDDNYNRFILTYYTD